MQVSGVFEVHSFGLSQDLAWEKIGTFGETTLCCHQLETLGLRTLHSQFSIQGLSGREEVLHCRDPPTGQTLHCPLDS